MIWKNHLNYLFFYKIKHLRSINDFSKVSIKLHVCFYIKNLKLPAWFRKQLLLYDFFIPV